MGITLTKKQTISLEKKGGGNLTKVSMGLGWDAAKSSSGGFLSKLFGVGAGGGSAIDLDASCIVMDANRSVLDVIWFRQLKSKDGNIVHSGDNRTGDGDGDDETIHVNLQRLGDNVKYLVFTVNSFTNQNFTDVDNAYCRIVDDTGNELARYNLTEQGNHTGLVMAYMTRQGNNWTVTAVGDTTHGRTVQDLTGSATRAIGG